MFYPHLLAQPLVGKEICLVLSTIPCCHPSPILLSSHPTGSSGTWIFKDSSPQQPVQSQDILWKRSSLGQFGCLREEALLTEVLTCGLKLWTRDVFAFSGCYLLEKKYTYKGKILSLFLRDRARQEVFWDSSQIRVQTLWHQQGSSSEHPAVGTHGLLTWKLGRDLPSAQGRGCHLCQLSPSEEIKLDITPEESVLFLVSSPSKNKEIQARGRAKLDVLCSLVLGL